MKKVIIIDTNYETESYFDGDTDIETIIVKNSDGIMSSRTIKHIPLQLINTFSF